MGDGRKKAIKESKMKNEERGKEKTEKGTVLRKRRERGDKGRKRCINEANARLKGDE